MTMRSIIAAIACLMVATSGRAADDVKEIDLTKIGFKATGRPMTPANKPTEIKTAEELEKAFPMKETVEAIKTAGDTRKFLFDADIIEIAEKVTGRTLDIIPHELNAIVNISVESQVYTNAVLRRLRAR